MGPTSRLPADAAASYARDGYLVVRDLVDRELVDRVRRSLEPRLTATGPRRLTNAWMALRPVAELASHPAALELVSAALGGPAFPFQTLDFRVGTEQRPHADTIHFDTLPTGGMCGLWVALQDVGPDDGPLVVYPGSHRLERLDPSSFGRTPEDFDVVDYEDRIESDLASAGLGGTAVELSAGDAVLWAAGLVHGGAAIRADGATRWSQVTHYARRGSLVVTPLASDVPRQEYRVRVPLVDAGTGRTEAPSGAVTLEHRWNRRTRVDVGDGAVMGRSARLRSDLVAATRSARWRARFVVSRATSRLPPE